MLHQPHQPPATTLRAAEGGLPWHAEGSSQVDVHDLNKALEGVRVLWEGGLHKLALGCVRGALANNEVCMMSCLAGKCAWWVVWSGVGVQQVG